MKYLFTFFVIFFFKTGYSQAGFSFSMPNYFVDSAKIEFTLVHADTVTLKVADMTGRVVGTFYNNSVLQAGSYTCYLNGDSLRPGIYMVNFIYRPDGVITRRIIRSNSQTGINDLPDQRPLAFFPNPTVNSITIPVEGIKEVRVFNICGGLVKYVHTDTNNLSLNDLPNGEYLVTVCKNGDDAVVMSGRISLMR